MQTLSFQSPIIPENHRLNRFSNRHPRKSGCISINPPHSRPSDSRNQNPQICYFGTDGITSCRRRRLNRFHISSGLNSRISYFGTDCILSGRRRRHNRFHRFFGLGKVERVLTTAEYPIAHSRLFVTKGDERRVRISIEARRYNNRACSTRI